MPNGIERFITGEHAKEHELELSPEQKQRLHEAYTCLKSPNPLRWPRGFQKTTSYVFHKLREA